MNEVRLFYNKKKTLNNFSFNLKKIVKTKTELLLTKM